jgi:hypothetical protein
MRRKEYILPGDLMRDGTIYGGSSSVDGEVLFCMPEDVKIPSGKNLLMSWRDAIDYGKGRLEFGYSDWRLPTKIELDTLFVNKEQGALRKTFNDRSFSHDCWYWALNETGSLSATAVNFTGGFEGNFNKNTRLSARLVRSTAPCSDYLY